MDITDQARHDFLEALWAYYATHARAELPWRQAGPNGSFDPYKIMVSELMLQQTQVSRAIPKYYEFLAAYPTIGSLADAELGAVLRVWQGLGYNRRAKFLWQAAQTIVAQHGFPRTQLALVALPGIGPNTAGAIMAYAYNEPVVFIETNIRTVYIHHFFHDQDSVNDKAIIRAVEQTLDSEQPREFYWALMDYGSHLKSTIGNLNKASKHYVKQSSFHGSRRQVRGAVLRELSRGPLERAELANRIADDRLESVLHDLSAESLIRRSGDTYQL